MILCIDWLMEGLAHEMLRSQGALFDMDFTCEADICRI